MRCKSCDYPLWNLKARQCPECGTPFTPGEFQFVVNSVRFCCPYCDQSYYGTGAKGHLVPAEFVCVSCSRRVSMDEMVLRPAAGLEEHHTQVRQMPWLRRAMRGRVGAWFATIGWALTMPGQLMKATPLSSGAGEAWRFALLTQVIVALAIGAPFLILLALAPAGLTVFLNAVVWLAVTLIFMCLWAPITHGLLMAGGATAGGMGRTAQAVCYASGTNALAAVPCVGALIALPWWAISAMAMVKEGQQVSWGRAAIATLAPPAVLVGLIIVFFMWALFGVRTLTMTQGGAFTTMQMETQAITAAIVAHAAANNGAGPTHAALLVDQGLAGANLVDWTRGNSEASVPVADTTLDLFENLPANRRAIKAQAAADAMPANVIAHRLGDFVFTYHGVKIGATDPGLWLVVQWSDPNVATALPGQPGAPPGQLSGPPAPLSVRVGLANGTVALLPTPFSLRLEEQNVLRQSVGLPPLPDPSRVTHGAPAMAGNGVVGD